MKPDTPHAKPELPSQSDLPANPARRRIFQAATAVGLASTGLPAMAAAKPAVARGSLDAKLKAHVKNVVVIYLENRSFNNLFANFPGTSAPLSAVTAEQAQQMDRNGKPLATLPKIWGGLVPNQQNIGGIDYQIKEDQITGLATSLPVLGQAHAAPTRQPAKGSLDAKLNASVKNVVVIYLENRSFNNLFANFPGTAAPLSAVPAASYAQRDRDGSVLPALAKASG